ncbi:hypothetical protein BO71DRAFT_312349 [Aspergillus ellipticus CBS 707.79]|uniref:Uncharacterized protein n=1 Tax=Aspergillus ellipticus CBS 707.79 TaxID=1448320 RepID=A0A319F508_9EURO|nr:hypothetical protein BO71DRAFT_312349 [Aspergillus ellipticus CBS 707.79]
MSASSGLRGQCDVCLHANNSHTTAPCPANRCRNRWKRCQVTGGCFRASNNWTYRMCYGCKDHPAAEDSLDFGAPRQKDVTRAQKEHFKQTGDAGGQTSGGELTSSSPPLQSSSP